MKRLLSVLLIIGILFSCAFAEGVDLSYLSFAQLLQMQQIINEEIVRRPEWKKTTVPVGVWTVGVDIPAGSYSISALDGESSHIGIKTGTGILDSTIILQTINSESSAIGKVDLQAGYVVTVEWNALVFSPALAIGF